MKNANKVINEYEKRKLDELFAKQEIVDILTSMKAATEDDENTFKGLAISTEHVDRMGEIVRQDGIDTSMYMKNPVILNSHNYYGIENIVGMTTKLYAGMVGDVKATRADGVFAPTEAGQMAKALWKAGCLSAASVGFIPEEFDKDNGSIITKSQLLEYSLVPVPANGWATRQEAVKFLTEKGVTFESLRTKGFDIKREPTGEAEEGDECSMEDGTIGVMSPSNGGKLVCVPKKDYEAMKAAKKTAEETGGGKNNDVSEASMWEDLKSEHDFHEKAVKGHVKECCEAMKAEDDKKPEEGDDEGEHEEKRMKAMAEHMKKLKTVMKAEHERHIKCVDECIKAIVKPKPDDHEDGDESEDVEKMIAKIIKAVVPSNLTEKETLELSMKIGKAMHKVTHERLTTLCDFIEEGHDIHTKAIDEFKALLAEHEPSEGDDASKGAPEKRSTPAAAADMTPEAIVELTRELNTATRDALTRYNREKGGKG